MARRAHPSRNDRRGLGGGMPCVRPFRDDLADPFIGDGLGVDDCSSWGRLYSEKVVPLEVARVDHAIGWVFVAGAVFIQAPRCFLKMLHLLVPSHPLRVGLSGLLQGLAVEQRLESVLNPLGVDPLGDIANERSILGLGGRAGQRDQDDQSVKHRGRRSEMVWQNFTWYSDGGSAPPQHIRFVYPECQNLAHNRS